ncbi:DUF3304 domain-containing protein [Collimonas sp. OK412]|uniref:DUF3304 domain-containing protein n=1 Tax=Collimonas sp. (strain OK412) TaxID=1801619 RepID=UPI0008EDC52E|nr:DUF3304 domain-containing protein [Collimonas sp. OK412]SFD39325.1 Protein of unknown function [Collimonas sp. OK412]
MKSSFVQSNFLRWLLLMLLTLSISACAGAGSNRLVAEGKIATSLSSVGHYGKGIGISEFYVNGTWGGTQHGWGGGGSTVCCVSLPRTINVPIMMTVKWETYRTAVTEERWHEATVPLHLSETKPGTGYDMVVHFLPGHKVEVWIADEGTGSPNYPGPAYPHGPPPDYVPLPDEKPEPTKEK